MMKKVLLLAVVMALVCALSVSASEEGAPKLIAKTVYDVKYVKNADGVLEERKIPRKQLFQIIQKKTSMADPLDASKTITVTVPHEVPYNPNSAASGKLTRLRARFQALQKRERELKQKFRLASSKKVDIPVLEDGAPAPPDAQEVKMAQELYGELEATQMHKAKNIKEADLLAARQYVKDSGSRHEANWDFFNDMKEKMLVPQHGWTMSM